MKTCPSCNAVMDDSIVFCTTCGAKLDDAPAYQAPVNPNPGYQAPQAPFNPNPAYNPVQAPVADPSDHTAEFAPEDVAANKIYAILVYLGGILGLIIAILLKKDSKYLEFHIRQAVRIYVAEVASTLLLLGYCLVIPVIAFAVLTIILFVVRIICFVNTAKGLSKEPAIIKNIDFLK